MSIMKQTAKMKTFEWCGYEWTCSMEGGRIIHPDKPWYWLDEDSVNITDNGVLELFIHKKPKTVVHWDYIEYKPTIACGLLRSVEDFGYGTFSAKIMLPTGVGLWPSFWLSGSNNWPPEIDIVEAYSDEDGYSRTFSWDITTNIHYRDDSNKHKQAGQKRICKLKYPYDPSSYYTEFKCKWYPDEIIFIADDRVIRRITGKKCKQLTKNMLDPDGGFRMNVIFNVIGVNPDIMRADMVHPMLVKNFEYKPLMII